MGANAREKAVEGWRGRSVLAEGEGYSLSLPSPLLPPPPPPQALLAVKNIAHQNKFGEGVPHSR